jgi:hypothetical protein
LESGEYLDSGDANVRSFAERTVAGIDGDVRCAVALYQRAR